MTSVSNETKNPAAQIVISKDGKEFFKGWLFSLYPSPMLSSTRDTASPWSIL